MGSEPRTLRLGSNPMPWFRSLFGAVLLAGACSTASDTPADPLTLNFGKGDNASWRALNDGVMGGRSIGVVDYSRKTMTWAGTVSLENNGGFSSVRSEWGTRDLSAFVHLNTTCTCNVETLSNGRPGVTLAKLKHVCHYTHDYCGKRSGHTPCNMEKPPATHRLR